MLYYYLGLYLGDGSCRYTYTRKDGSHLYRVTFVCKEPHYKDIEEWFVDYNYQQSKGKNEYRCYSTSNKDIINQLIELCGDSYNKHLPKNMSIEEKWNLLSGFIDSDGCVDKDKLRMYNTNRKLIDEIEQCLDSLNIEYTECVVSKRNKTCWAIQINSSELIHCNFSLKIDYKRDRLDILTARSKGRLKFFQEDWYRENIENMSRVVKRRTLLERLNGRFSIRCYLYEKEIYKLIENGCVVSEPLLNSYY